MRWFILSAALSAQVEVAPLSEDLRADQAMAAWLDIWPVSEQLGAGAFTLDSSGPVSDSPHWVVAAKGVTREAVLPEESRLWIASLSDRYAIRVLPWIDADGAPMWEPDTEVQLRDFERGSQQIILYCGTSCSFHTAVWTDSETVLVTGADQDHLRPVIYRVNARDLVVDKFVGESVGEESRAKVRRSLWEFRSEWAPWVKWYRPN